MRGNFGCLLLMQSDERSSAEVSLAVGDATDVSKKRNLQEQWLLPYLDRCTHPRLREAIEREDRMAIEKGMLLLLAFGTPEEVAGRINSNNVDEQRGEHGEKGSSCARFGVADGTGTPVPLVPICSSPRNEYSDWSDAEDELVCRCTYFRRTFTNKNFSYNLPRDVQRNVVIFLYTWIVNWDFMIRNVSAWSSVVSCFCSVVRGRRKYALKHPGFSLPWKPLVDIVHSLVFESSRLSRIRFYTHVKAEVAEILANLCWCASLHFDGESLNGLWEICAPYFSQDSEQAPQALWFLYILLPIHATYDRVTGRALPMTERIVRFLLVDARYWQQRSGSWLMVSLDIVFKICRERAGIMDLDEYAETLFSMILSVMRPPISSNDKPERLVSSAWSFGGRKVLEVSQGRFMKIVGRISEALPCCTTSPLWNQLRRFVSSTSVFLTPCAVDSRALGHLLSFYNTFLETAYLRVKHKHSWLLTGEKDPGNGFVINGYRWKRETVDSLVEIVAPAIIPALYHGHHSIINAVGLLTLLSPKIMQPPTFKYVEAGIRGCLESPLQCSVAFKLFTKTLLPFSECSETRESCRAFLSEILPLVPQWINCSSIQLSNSVREFLFAVFTVLNLDELLGSEVAECEFAVSVVEQLFHSAKRGDTEDSDADVLASIIDSLSHNVSDEAYSDCLKKALKEAETQVKNSQVPSVGCLLEPLARRSPERVMKWAIARLLPPLRSDVNTCNDEEVLWCSSLLSSCVCGAGLACFPYRYELLDCIQAQLFSITNRKRRCCAALLYTAVFFAFSETRCVGVRAVDSSLVRGDHMMEEESCAAEGDSEQKQDKSSMGLYRYFDVEPVWQEPSEEHVSFLHEVYQLFLTDLTDIIQNIEHIRVPSRKEAARGLRAFLPPHLSPSSHHDSVNEGLRENGGCVDDSVRQLVSHQAPSAPDAEGSHDVVTPHNVLCGAVCWLDTVWAVNCELRVQCATDGETNMTPWHYKDPKTPWPLHEVSPSLLEKSTRLTESIHSLLLDYVLRRVTGGVADEAVIATVLRRDQSLLVRGKLPLDVAHTKGVDVDTLCYVLTLFFREMGLDTRTNIPNDYTIPFDVEFKHFSAIIVESERHRFYFPALFWRLRSEYLLHCRRQQNPMVVYPQYLGDTLSIAYSLLFSPYPDVRKHCSCILRTYLPYLGFDGCRQFLLRHFDVLEGIIDFVRQEGDVCSGEKNSICDKEGHTGPGEEILQIENCGSEGNDSCVEGDRGSDAAKICDVFFVEGCTGAETSQSKSDDHGKGSALANASDDIATSGVGEKGSLVQLRKALSGAIMQTVIGFSLDVYQRDASFIRRMFEVGLKIPDQLRRTGSACSLYGDRAAEVCTPFLIEPRAIACLTDELLPLAMKCSHTAPTFAVQMLRTLSCNHIQLHYELLSPASIAALFKLTVDICAETRRSAFSVLRVVLYSLKEKTPKVNILMRKGSMEGEDTTSFFSNRYRFLQENHTSFSLHGKMGLVFPPKSIRVDRTCAPPDISGDGEVFTVPDNEVPGLRLRMQSFTACHEEKDLAERRMVRQGLKNLISKLAGILDDNENTSKGAQEQASDTDDSVGKVLVNEAAIEKRIRGTWVWNVLLANRDQTSFSVGLASMWRSLGEAAGVEETVKRYIQVAYLWFSDYMKLVQSESNRSKEYPQELPCLVDVIVAAICLSKRNPKLRREALDCYVSMLLQACSNILLSHTVLMSFISGLGALYGKVKTHDVWSMYEPFFDMLTPLDDGSGSPVNVTSGVRDSDSVEPNIKVAFTGVKRGILRALHVITKLLDVFAADVNIVLLPKLCRCILDRQKIFLFSDSNEIRHYAATSLRYLLRLSLYQSKYIPSNNSAQSVVLDFLRQLNCIVRLQVCYPPTVLNSGFPFQVATTCITAVNANEDMLVVNKHPVASDNKNHGNTSDVSTTAEQAGLKTLTSMWHSPPPELFSVMWMEAITTATTALDGASLDNDDFETVALSTLSSFALSRQRKDVIQSVVKFLCDVLEGNYPFGKTRRAKVVLTRAFYQMLLMNLHRIGKYETMRSVFSACVGCMSHGDGDLRANTRSLLAVLSRVASIEQINSLVQQCAKELQEYSISSDRDTGGVAEEPLPAVIERENNRKRRRAALVRCLCAFLSSDVGPITPHVKFLMRKLAPLEHDAMAEVQREVKVAFEQWWKAHANGWELYHRESFTPKEIELIMPLMKMPKYLV